MNRTETGHTNVVIGLLVTILFLVALIFLKVFGWI